jgi:hypothetical protein
VTGGCIRAAVDSAEHLSQLHDGLADVVDEQSRNRASIFANWERTATVRNPSPRLPDGPAPAGGWLFFPPELVPAHAHPLLAARGEKVRRRFLVRALCQYLNFTSELESVTVIPAATELIRGRSGLALPEPSQCEAYYIVIDEAWHAQFSHELQHKVAAQSGERIHVTPEPMLFAKRLERVARELQPLISFDARLLFAIVSETLVSALLGQIPHDPRLPAIVRQIVGDHARDEGRHHAYFRDVLRHLWPVISGSERRTIGPRLPSMILAFLEPDYRNLSDSLAALDFAPDEIEAVLLDSYPRRQVLSTVVAAARPTIRYFAEVGALEDPATADAFAALTDGTDGDQATTEATALAGPA